MLIDFEANSNKKKSMIQLNEIGLSGVFLQT